MQKTLRTVATNLLEGGALVVLTLVLMLRNLRAGLIGAAMIPLCTVSYTHLTLPTSDLV